LGRRFVFPQLCAQKDFWAQPRGKFGVNEKFMFFAQFHP